MCQESEVADKADLPSKARVVARTSLVQSGPAEAEFAVVQHTEYMRVRAPSTNKEATLRHGNARRR